MKESQSYRISNGSHRFLAQSDEDPESYCWAPIHNIDNLKAANDSQGSHLAVKTFTQYCTLESSSGTSSNPVQNSSSSVSFSPNGSPSSQPETQSYLTYQHLSPDNFCGSPVSHSCLTDDTDDLRHKIRELESVMQGTDSDFPEMYNISNQVEQNEVSLEGDNWGRLMDMLSASDLKGLLFICAQAVAENDKSTTEWLISELRQLVSVSGDPLQRLSAYMLEGLVAKMASSGSSIYKALRCKEPASAELFSYMHILYEICPYFKFGYMSANGAIAEAVKDESVVHIIDFQIVQGAQWMILIHALSTRPGGPPKMRITAIDDSTSAYARGGGLEIVGLRLSKIAESCKVPFEFNAVDTSVAEVQLEDLGVRPGEAIAVNFALMLHHMPDESVGSQTPNHRDRLLRLTKSLSPNVVTLVEQELNTNTAPFYSRFVETFNYYMAVFESLDVTLPREHKERINVEQHCLARDIVNVIACDGPERVERHEMLGKWRSRFTMAGFRPYPLSPLVNSTIKALLQNYSEKFTLEERDGALYLGWMDKAMISSCAWR
ncbi:scarecrow-like transcription factor PAT1 [Cannabis sativa]|uniref:scarecrow-like transcription factor PAT1 n=1 Tax=Cannabis sativa TaxID=3483 RepID=UPI0011E03539|nr:scarecrow-like transcription factor PAT1 [Cannabis sativa]